MAPFRRSVAGGGMAVVYGLCVDDDFSAHHAGLLDGCYDCADRVVLNAFYRPGATGGGMRSWWRLLHDGSDDGLDDTHLMRMAGRFGRRVRAWGAANDVPVIYCEAGEAKFLIARRYLRDHPPAGPGVFLVLAGPARAPVWKARRRGGFIQLNRSWRYVMHYSFHIWDAQWGHVVIKMPGHPPFGAQVMLNGHEYVAIAAAGQGICFTKEENCFTEITDPRGLGQVADTLSQQAAEGRLAQAADRWIYTACLVFGLDLQEQERSGFRYQYSVYQVEYSRNLLFKSGAQMQDLFGRVLDRSRSRLDPDELRTIFGVRSRPRSAAGKPGTLPPQECVIGRPEYDVTKIRLRFGKLQVKAYTKGERVLRFEATVVNARALRVPRDLGSSGQILSLLAGLTSRFATALDCADTSFLPGGILDELPRPARVGAARTGGIDLNRPRARAVLAATVALAPAPDGFTAADLAAKVRKLGGDTTYTARQASYDLRKLRGKQLIDLPPGTRRYQLPARSARIVTALLTLRDHVIAPLLTAAGTPAPGPRPAHPSRIDDDYAMLRNAMHYLFQDLGISTARTTAQAA
jgi:hypothetical protein